MKEGIEGEKDLIGVEGHVDWFLGSLKRERRIILRLNEKFLRGRGGKREEKKKKRVEWKIVRGSKLGRNSSWNQSILGGGVINYEEFWNAVYDGAG